MSQVKLSESLGEVEGQLAELVEFIHGANPKGLAGDGPVKADARVRGATLVTKRGQLKKEFRAAVLGQVTSVLPLLRAVIADLHKAKL